MDKEKILDTIYTNIKAALELREMTEQEFYKAIGVARGYLDRKRDDIGITRLIQIAETLKIRPEDLWNEEFTKELHVMDLKGKIERLTMELEAIEMPVSQWMAKPIEEDEEPKHEGRRKKD